jgi:RNA polymerase sigma factor (TIGR02999 family)
MSDITRLLTSVQQGDTAAAERLLPLVYEELRRLAARKMAREGPGHSLQPTDLVHEAYVRLVDGSADLAVNDRQYFFAAAAEAMRRILVERARRKQTMRQGGHLRRQELLDDEIAIPEPSEDLLELSEALDRLESKDKRKATLVKLRYFAGFTSAEAAEVLGVSAATAERDWAYARAWLRREITGHGAFEAD